MKKQAYILIIILSLFAGKVAGQCVSVGSDQTICQDEITAALGGSLAGDAANPIWDDGGVGGIFSNVNDPDATWDPNGYTGTATLTLTAGSGTFAVLRW